MSTEEQDKLIGSLFRRQREAKREADLLAVKLRDVGASLRIMGRWLEEANFKTAAEKIESFQSELLDLTKLSQLLTDYKAASDRAAELARELESQK